MSETTLKSSDFFPTIENSILNAVVKTFRTKRDAIVTGSQFGWRRAVKVVRRFETVWIIGAIDFQNTEENGITFQCLRLPMLKFEQVTQPILILRRIVAHKT